MTQLQVTLASVQELLIQQQQKVQELAHELATAKVPVPDPVPRFPPVLSASSPLPWGLTWSFLTLTARWAHTALVQERGVRSAWRLPFLSPWHLPRSEEEQLSAWGLPWSHMLACEADGVDTE